MQFENRSLFTKSEGVETRWASPENPKAEKGKAAQALNGRKGSECFPLKAGESRILAEESGVSGIIRRIWSTIDDRDIVMLRGLRLDFYWDGCAKPAVSCPFGDFFGTGLGRTAPFQSALFTSPEGRSFNCYIPMPFKSGMKIVVTNESGKDLSTFYYDINYTIKDKHGDDVLYFHAYYHRENPTKMQIDYEILPKVYGNGRYIGCNIGVIANTELYYTAWWGEGEVKVFLDGDTKYPTLSGTGTEDYIGTGWRQGRFDHLYQGCHVADAENSQYCFYRYHILDPIYFSTDIMVTIQQIGCWSPKVRPMLHFMDNCIYSKNMERIDFSKYTEMAEYGQFERQDDWSSCAYFYLDRPESSLPFLKPQE